MNHQEMPIENKNKSRILIVDDSQANVEYLKSILQNENYMLAVSNNGSNAITKAKGNRFDLILLDIIMDGLSGYEVCLELKRNASTKDIPIIFLTGMTDTESLTRAFDSGAVDYVKKPFNKAELLARIHTHIELKKSRDLIKEKNKELEYEKEKSDALLHNILPHETAEELKKYGKAQTKYYESASVLFTDFKGFTKIAESLSPKELVEELDFIFTKFDDIIAKFKLEKIKTIGDAYMCAGGIPVANAKNSFAMVLAGLEIQEFMTAHNLEKIQKQAVLWHLRLGIHTGELIAGVVGKQKFAYDVWGDTVNTASRMESAGEPGKVNISDSTYEIVKDFFDCTFRGKIAVKNKGEIAMYFVERIKPRFAKDAAGFEPNALFWSYIGL